MQIPSPRQLSLIALCATLLLLSRAPTAPAADSDAPAANLVRNGSFEQLDRARPAGWAAYGDAAVKQELTAAAGKVGRRAAKLHCSAFEHRGGSSHAMLAQVGEVAVEKGRMYRFCCWVRAEGIRSRHVQVALSDTKTWSNCGLRSGMVVGRTWRRFETYFTATKTVGKTTRLQFWYGETGTLWLDAVEITPAAKLAVRFTDTIEPGEGPNLLPNASFECGSDGWASLGTPAGWGNLSGLVGRIVEADAPHGKRCLRIDLGPGKTPVTHFDYFQPVRVVQNAPLAANVGWVELDRGAKYTLSVAMRADRPGVPARLATCQCDAGDWQKRQDRKITLSEKWQRYALPVQAVRDYLFVAVGPDLSGARRTEATVWIDAVQLERSDKPTDFVPRQPIEVGLSSGRFGNVFHVGRPVRLRVDGRNETARPAMVELTAVAKDFFDRPVKLEGLQLTIPPSGTATGTWDLKLTHPGYYRLAVTWRHGGRRHRRTLRLAVIRPYTEADSPFGINHAPPTAELCRLLRQAGVVWARDWSLKWQHVEPAPGRFDLAVAATQINRVLDAGMKQVCLLPPFPSSNWASSAPETLSTKGYPGSRLKMAYAPKDPKLLAAYIERCARHFDGRVDVWDFLNEPIYTDYSLPAASKGLPGAAYTVEDYVGLLKLAYAAIKRADPTCRVLGGIGGGPDLLTRELFAAGGLDHLDILNLHTYPGRALPESYLAPMAGLLGRMRRLGKVKPIWFTEYSYYATDDLPWKPFIRKHRSWAADRLLADERQCADYSVRFALVMLASGVEKVFYHSGASGEVNRPPLECCLLAYAGRPRKVFAAQAALADPLGPAPRFAARLDPPKLAGKDADDALYAFCYQCGRRALLAAWADREILADPWRLAVPDGAELRDIVGRPIHDKRPELISSPIYAVSRILSAAELARACAFVPPSK